MTPSEVADLLSLSSELDRYATADKMTRERVVAWTAVIGSEAPQMTFDEAQQIVIRYYGTAGESLTVYALIDLWKQSRRMAPHQIAADVRSAKARGLIGRDWDTRTALPADVAGRLAAARDEERQAAPGEVDSGPSKLRLEVGKRVPRE